MHALHFGIILQIDSHVSCMYISAFRNHSPSWDLKRRQVRHAMLQIDSHVLCMYISAFRNYSLCGDMKMRQVRHAGSLEPTYIWISRICDMAECVYRTYLSWIVAQALSL